jgi:para-nitrobenzyl esterase
LLVKSLHTFGILLGCLFVEAACGDDPPRPGAGGNGGALLRRFDANGDGKIDDAERRAVREKLRERQSRPGAMTPSGETETVGSRLVTEMEYASSDGRKIPCVLSMPEGEGPFPVLVTIHGGQGNRDLGYIRSMAAPGGVSPTVTAFNEQPWAILAISYRAGNGALFGMEHDDVIAGIRFAKTLPKVDPDRVGVVGGSHGGHLALVAAEKMGREFLCVAAGSPWMTDPIVYMTGEPDRPPLSEVPAEPRKAIVGSGRKLFANLQRGRGLSEEQAREFLARQSIEAQADRIEVPTLFLTSRGDDQVPHALVEPMVKKMQAAGKDVEIYTAEKSPHGFYWARTVSAARALRGEKTPTEYREEEEARRRMIDFFARHFARKAAADEASTGREPAVPRNGAQPARPHASPVARSRPVRITSGQLVGEQRDGVRVFRGIPYAAPPVGPRRWKAPDPPMRWEGVREAVSFGPPALQAETFTPRNEQSEDCLFLNVWTPAEATTDEKLPVLVWIHGGAFLQGSGGQPRYDGTELARRGVVVVTINYRLGPLGLFAHPALTAAATADEPLANYCLLDMIAALRWVRDNIAAFGGDSANVAISGSSAGGTSCLFLMGIPGSRGLFHKAVIHSSGGMRNILSLAEAEAAGARLADRLRLGGNVTAADLRRPRGDDVAAGIGTVRQLGLPVKPVIDGRLVTAVPEETFAAGTQARIPVLIGAANGESGGRQGDELATGGAFGFQRGLADDMARVGQPVWMFQFSFVPPTSRASRAVAQHGESVAYAFGTIGGSVAAQYGFRDDATAARSVRARRTGTRGGEDEESAVEDSREGREISAGLMSYLVAFLRDGRPAAEGLPEWPQHTATAPRAMVFGNDGMVVR